MIEKIIVPDLGESITEATVAKWLKNKGDPVLVDEPIVELETEKVNLEVPSPVDGTLTDISANNGQVVAVGALLGSITESEKKEKIINKVSLNNDKIKDDKEDVTKFFNNDSDKIEKEKVKNTEEPLVLNTIYDVYLIGFYLSNPTYTGLAPYFLIQIDELNIQRYSNNNTLRNAIKVTNMYKIDGDSSPPISCWETTGMNKQYITTVTPMTISQLTVTLTNVGGENDNTEDVFMDSQTDESINSNELGFDLEFVART